MRAFRIAYDGQPYHGFQRQPDVETVEDTLFDALRDLDVLEDDAPSHYAAAGRTDAGVSALAQTIAFDAPDWLTPAAFNSELPRSVRAWARTDTPNDFHATHHAIEREYTYFLHAPQADDARVREALDTLSGTQDFHNLTPDGSGTQRTLTTALARSGPFLELRFTAGGFPRQLVRRAVTLVAAVAREEAGLERIERALDATPLLGPAGIEPAPPDPLVLTAVPYDLTFTVDEEAASRTRQLFEGLQVDRATGARVAGRISDGIR